MYLSEYEQLGGIGKKLKKFVKKVAAPVAHIGAAVFTGGASLAASAKIIQAQQARKAQAAQAKVQAETDKAAIAAQERVAMAQLQPSVAPPVSQTALTPSIAPPAGLVQQMMPVPTMTLGPREQPQYEPFPAAPSQQPAWLIPAAIGGGVLLVAMMGRRR